MVNKKDLERYVLDKLDDLKEIKIRNRELVIMPMTEFISVIYGPRRSGKSYYLYSKFKGSREKGVLYLNFDDIQLGDWKADDLMDAVSLFQEIFGIEAKLIMLDEIQNVKGWENAVKTLYEKKRHNIILTGSSSRLLSREISTSLRGRSLAYPLLPLSFKEYLNFKNLPVSKTTRGLTRSRSALEEYLSYGSFPGPLCEKGILSRFYDDYLDLVIYRDLVERFGISNLGLMKFLIKSVIRSFSKEISVNRLYNDWRSMRYEASKRTFYQYFSYLEDAMFALPLRKYSRSERTSDLSIPKVYLPDTGLPSHLHGYQKGRAMENCVYLELFRRSSRNSGISLYYHRGRSSEVDFVVCRGNDPNELIQVTVSLTPENLNREVNSLISFGDEIGCKNRRIITWAGSEDAGEGIEVTSLLDFLFEEDMNK